MSAAAITHHTSDESQLWPRKWIAFACLWGLFYLATPLDVLFSSSELANVEQSDLTADDRAETNAEATSEGSLTRRIGLLLLGACGLAGLVRPSSRRLSMNGLLAISALFFIGWCGLSIVWSIDPRMTARKLVALGLLLLGAVGFARQYSLSDLVRFTIFSSALMLIGGLVCEFGLRTFRPWESTYRFTGLTWPAFLSWMLSLLSLACLTMLSKSNRYRGWFLTLLCAAVLGVILTKTRAGLAALVAALALYALLTWPPRRTILSAGLIVLLAAVGLLAAELIAGNVGDKLNNIVNLGRAKSAEGLSGRQDLWLDLISYVRARPLTGFGYESFWTPEHLLEIGERHWGAPDAHNGYLNLTLGVGLVGMLACLATWVLSLVVSLRRFIDTGDQNYAFASCALVVLMINTMFVSTQLAPALYGFITMVIVAQLGFITEREQNAESPS